MFKYGDWVTTEFNGGVGQIVETDAMNGMLRIKWVDEPGMMWHTDGRILPLGIAKTKLWKYLYEVP
jgi:hypothetical protein